MYFFYKKLWAQGEARLEFQKRLESNKKKGLASLFAVIYRDKKTKKWAQIGGPQGGRGGIGGNGSTIPLKVKKIPPPPSYVSKIMANYPSEMHNWNAWLRRFKGLGVGHVDELWRRGDAANRGGIEFFPLIIESQPRIISVVEKDGDGSSTRFDKELLD